MFSTNCVALLFMLSVQITFLNGMDSGFTFLLAARKRECFFETLKVNMSLDLEYQVYKYFVDFIYKNDFLYRYKQFL